jgi:AcrR family transcriptional regulator
MPPASSSADLRYRVGETRLLDAACAVFAAEGFDGATMEAIAERAGTTKPTLYARFGSKEGLFAAAVRREYELLKTQLFVAYESDEDEPFHRRLHRWTTAYFDFVRDRPDGARLTSEGERHPAAAAIVERASDEIVDHIAELVLRVSKVPAPRGARIVAAMIAGMLTRCGRAVLNDPDVELDAAAALCESFLYDALRPLDPDLLAAVDRPRA